MNAVRDHPLSRAEILRAAITLADSEGLAAVTMRRLGDALEVEAMALYRHVANKQDILDGMATMLMAEITPPSVGLGKSWQQILREISWAYRRVIVDHPAVFTAQAGRPIVLDENQAAFKHVMATLRQAGFPRDVALDLYQIGSSFARGFALSDIAYAAASHSLPDDCDSDRAFGRGLETIISGFEQFIGDVGPGCDRAG
ncbi:TetR family transcriptional regulator [Brevibacterium ihuae]|uniref:TetR family transcriptional regulator n=1 Tax=Brevibacterium ihuae TaxID=1631743 RepID=UPI001C60AF2B|nr:TetR/AcrR family transcriptional regulator C-terminal domain-containing protein [Brevibacterium ihuae]